MNALAPNFGLAHVLQHAPDDLADRKHSIGSLVHQAPPSSRPDNGDDEAEMKSGPNTGNCRTSSDPMNERRTRVHRSLVLHVSDPAKVVAQRIDASHRTVEADRAAIPKSWDRLIAYARLSPEFAMDMAIEMGLEFDRDRDAYAAFLSLQQRIRGQ